MLPPRRLSLRTYQLLLVLGTALPLIILAVWLSLTLVKYNDETLSAGATNRLRAFMSAVDAELKGAVASLQALEVSERLGADDLRGFHREAVRFLHSQPRIDSVRLALPDGQIVVNTRRPFGESLPETSDHKSFEQVLLTREPVIGDVVFGGAAKTHMINVRIPVLRNGKIAYVLTAGINPEKFGALIDQQHLKPGWISGLVDRNGRFIARRPALPPGSSASPAFLAAIATAPEGWYRGLTVESRDTFTAYVTSGFSRWSIGLAIPTSEVYAPAERIAWLMTIGFLVSLGLAFTFAYWMGRRISGPIASLASTARFLGGANAPPLPEESDIREVAELATTLKEASLAIRERQRLAQSEKEALQAADKAKNEFIAMLSHELRNPLAVLTTSVHLLRAAQPGDELAIKARTVIERQLKLMARLIEDLLDISRVATGKISLRREVFDLADLVVRVVAGWRPAAQREARKFLTDVAPVWIEADKTRIEQVLSNLLDNAQKFSPAEKPIRVNVSRQDGCAVLTVADEGEGIEAAMLEKVFGLFVQGAQGPDRARGGMGVGLALVKRLTEMHDGSVTAASDGPGSGATFTVRIPAVAKPADREMPAPGARNASAKRILIIEDNQDGREMLRALLTLDGHDVHTASDGATGLELAAKINPDVALIDIGLPDIDGYEVAARMRANDANRHISLVAITGYGQEQDERRAVRAGFDLHLTKPVAPERLRQVLETLDSTR